MKIIAVLFSVIAIFFSGKLLYSTYFNKPPVVVETVRDFNVVQDGLGNFEVINLKTNKKVSFKSTYTEKIQRVTSGDNIVAWIVQKVSISTPEGQKRVYRDEEVKGYSLWIYDVKVDKTTELIKDVDNSKDGFVNGNVPGIFINGDRMVVLTRVYSFYYINLLNNSIKKVEASNVTNEHLDISGTDTILQPNMAFYKDKLYFRGWRSGTEAIISYDINSGVFDLVKSGNVRIKNMQIDQQKGVLYWSEIGYSANDEKLKKLKLSN